jgi:hypothetical protein
MPVETQRPRLKIGPAGYEGVPTKKGAVVAPFAIEYLCATQYRALV